MTPYDYLDQVIVATALIQPYDDDSFYKPTTNNHTGYDSMGNLYVNGVQIVSPTAIPIPFATYQASWASETPGAYRGDGTPFPQAGLILLSPIALTILDQGTPTLEAAALPLWMEFILADMYALANNFDGMLNGWTPSALTYADGIVSVTYLPDAGNQTSDSISPPNSTGANSSMVVSFDFTRDMIYLDVAL